MNLTSNFMSNGLHPDGVLKHFIHAIWTSTNDMAYNFYEGHDVCTIALCACISTQMESSVVLHENVTIKLKLIIRTIVAELYIPTQHSLYH